MASTRTTEQNPVVYRGARRTKTFFDAAITFVADFVVQLSRAVVRIVVFSTGRSVVVCAKQEQENCSNRHDGGDVRTTRRIDKRIQRSVGSNVARGERPVI